MADYDFDLAVIGGGSGGVRCARVAAGHGARVAVIESRHWGGTCVNLGCVPKKMMVMASDYADQAEDARGFGWRGNEPGHHDWGALMRAKDAEITRLNGVYTRMLAAAGVTLFSAHACLDGSRELVLEPGPLDEGFAPRRITAGRVVIATGGRAVVQPAIEGHEHAITSDQAFHLPDRPRRVVMVGGGYIGIEFAGIFAGLGSEVSLVARQPLPLRGFDHDLRENLLEAIEQRGISWHGGRTLHRIERRNGAFRVTLDDGAQQDTDLVFVAVGRRPNVDGLGLDSAGVRTDHDGRVMVSDGTAETTAPGIYAIGDVCNRQNLTPVAIAEGHHLADALFGPPPARSWSLDSVPKAVFFTPPLASVGLTEAEAAVRPNGADVYLTRFRPMRHTLSGRERRTLMKLIVDRTDDRVLGAHMLGEDAPELMQGLAVAVTAGLPKHMLDRTVGIHPTAAEEFVTLRTPTRQAGGH